MPCFAPLPRVLAPPRRAAARGRGRVRAKTAREDEAARRRRRRTTTPSRRRAYRARTCARTAPTNDLIEALEGRALTRAGDGEDADAIDAEASAVAGCGDAELVETLSERARELTGPEVSNLQYNVQYLIYSTRVPVLSCSPTVCTCTRTELLSYFRTKDYLRRKYESTFVPVHVRVLPKYFQYFRTCTCTRTKVRRYFRKYFRTFVPSYNLSSVHMIRVLPEVRKYFRTKVLPEVHVLPEVQYTYT